MKRREGFLILLNELILGRSSFRFLLGVIISFSFSIAVILCTVGIMDGFDATLKKGLKQASGDITVYSRDGFFNYQDLKEVFDDLDISDYSSILQTEGFLIHNTTSKGVVIKGIDHDEFERVTKLKLSLGDEGVVVGKELALQLKLKIGDSIVLALASGKSGFSNLPFLRRLKINDIVTHGIYDKDLRFVYIDKGFLQNSLVHTGKVNIVSLNVPTNFYPTMNDSDRIYDFAESVLQRLENLRPSSFIVRPYWQEFSGLLEAVKIEKFSISLILQLVVVMAIFNVAAFFIYINEKKAQEIFLFRALGVRQKEFVLCWLGTIVILWIISCLISIGLADIFNWCLGNINFLKIPGDVYVLNQLQLQLDISDYIIVFASALFWMSLIAGLSIWRIMRQSVLQGLRREFS